MRSLITGAEGFAGSHLTDYLLSCGEEVIALVRDARDVANLKHIRKQIRIEEADVRHGERVSEVLRDTSPQRIYHLAAISSPRTSLENLRLTYEVNFGGTLNLLCAWRDFQFDCRFLLVSSSDVYGPVRGENLPLREDQPVNPATPYAGSKAAAESLSVQFFQGYGLPIVRVRPFNHTGPRQSSAFVCASLARQIAEADLGIREPIITVGDLGVQRDFSDVRDIVRGYYLLLEKGIPGEVYHLCSGRSISIEQILGILKTHATTLVEIAIDPTRARPQDPAIIQGDASKARRAVGWGPEYDLETTLRDLKFYWDRTLSSEGSANSREL